MMSRLASRLLLYKEVDKIHQMQVKNFKNFGHKREPVPRFTFYWHAFLTFSFIGLGIEWKRMAKLLFGEEVERPIPVK